MTCKRAAATIFLVLALPSAALAQAGTITKGMQNNCVNDYKKFCGDYGLANRGAQFVHEESGPDPCRRLACRRWFRPERSRKRTWIRSRRR